MSTVFCENFFDAIKVARTHKDCGAGRSLEDQKSRLGVASRVGRTLAYSQGEISRVYADDRLLSGGKNIEEDNSVRATKRPDEAVPQRRRPGVGMRTEDDCDLLVSHSADGIDSRRDLGGMMGVIIDYGIARARCDHLKAARYTAKGGESLGDGIGWDSELGGNGDGGKGVLQIKATRNLQVKLAERLASVINGKASGIADGEDLVTVVGERGCAEANGIHLCALHNSNKTLVIGIVDGQICRGSKSRKGALEGVNIGKIIGVIELEIEKKRDGRSGGEKGITILAGLVNEETVAAANKTVLSYIRSAKHGWRKIGEKMREHRRDRALAVRACNSYGRGVFRDEHTEQMRTADESLSSCRGKGALVIVCGNSERIHADRIGRYSLGIVSLPNLKSIG